MGCHADSSWLIALLDAGDHHHHEAVSHLAKLGAVPAMSAMALGEILSSFESHRRIRFKKLSAGFQIVPVDAEVAAKAAEIRVENRIALGDAIIIASALIHDTELLTFDKRMQSVFERLR